MIVGANGGFITVSNAKFFGILAIIIIAVVGGALFFTRSNGKNNDVKPADVAKVTKADYVQGNPEAKVTLIEYGDFQCPYCGAVYPVLKEVLPEYKKDVRFVFRHFPITSIHPNSLVAHKAAEAAAEQNKFWEMHDKIYGNQAAWSSSTEPIKIFEGYAKDLKLNLDKFKKDFKDTATIDRINKVKGAGSAAGVESTPTLFINGKKMDSPRSSDELRQKLDDAIKQIKSEKK